jgi:hypothetical protein
MGSGQRRPAGTRVPPLALLSAVLTGLLAGGMVLIDVVLLPFWRSVPPAEFRRWFTANAPRIRTLMVPLGAGAAIVSVASAVTDGLLVRRRSRASLTAAAATVGVVAVTVTVSEPANHRFTGGSRPMPRPGNYSADGRAGTTSASSSVSSPRWPRRRPSPGAGPEAVPGSDPHPRAACRMADR